MEFVGQSVFADSYYRGSVFKSFVSNKEFIWINERGEEDTAVSNAVVAVDQVLLPAFGRVLAAPADREELDAFQEQDVASRFEFAFAQCDYPVFQVKVREGAFH